MKRQGSIKINRSLLLITKDHYFAYAVFGKFIPFNIEYDALNDVMTYTGVSTFFDEIPEGSVAPIYEVIIGTCGNRFDINFNRLS